MKVNIQEKVNKYMNEQFFKHSLMNYMEKLFDENVYENDIDEDRGN
jgi:hypothetical protein